MYKGFMSLHGPFLMELSQALGIINLASPEQARNLADLIRGKNIAVLSDEPYCHMVWKGRHRSLLEFPGMMDQCVAAYTFSKSYSMSGWRLGFAVSSAAIIDAIGKMINTTLSCTPPIVQLAGLAALERDSAERDKKEENRQVTKYSREHGSLKRQLWRLPASFSDCKKAKMARGVTYVAAGGVLKNE